MQFTLHQDKVITSTKGHTIRFEKGVPVHVPREMHQEVMGIGAVASDELPVEKKINDHEPENAETREKMITDAMGMLADANKREDFTGTGVPTLPALTGVLGFKIDQKERDSLWTKYLQARGE